ncbi:MAG: thiol-disulfide oxidoreductase DCC family protein [Saprospiraceae bacterium]
MATKPTILYDGHCALCSGAVQSILRIDDRGVFQFAPLQSAYAKTLLANSDLDLESLDSIIAADESGIYIKSNAFFHIMKLVGWPYRALNLLKVFPLVVRDWVYDWVARNRYATFGKHDACWMPQKEWKGRFLEE